jgi:GntR family transcriptional regulator, negative regulator for fad regulon and positive regulator of fabA
MTQWEAPNKPAELTENRLVEAILDGTFAINSTLPPERELAEQLGITRPTLREALQRLSRDGWLEIRHGKSTRVRDFWREGNLTILGTIARFPQFLPADFVKHLLQIRLLLAPEYTRLAVANAREEVLQYLEGRKDLPDSAEAYVEFDMNLHILCTQLSGNPVFTLIFNGFGDTYLSMGKLYFSVPASRASSQGYYESLFAAAASGNLNPVEQVVRGIMLESIALWEKAESIRSSK